LEKLGTNLGTFIKISEPLKSFKNSRKVLEILLKNPGNIRKKRKICGKIFVKEKFGENLEISKN
jgi:hypothetical protein